MKLCISKPDNADGEIIYSLPYDFTAEGKAADGHFCATKQKILLYLNGKPLKEYNISDFSEFECRQQIGTSMACGITAEGETICFCAFTQDKFLRFAELLKLLDYYVRTGEFVIEADADEPVCPKCGLPLDGAKECIFCTSKSKTMIKLIKRIAPYKKYFAIAVICTILSESLWVIMPYLDRIIIDRYVTPKSAEWAGFAAVVITVVTLLLLAGIFEFFNMKSSFKVALNLGRDLRQDVFRKSQELSMNSISKRTAGELINRVSSDAAKLEDFITANGKDAIVKILSLIIIGVLLFVMDWRLALMTVIPVPIVFMIVSKLFDTMAIRYTKVWKKGVTHGETLHDILNGIRVVKSYGNEVREIQRYSECSEQWAKSAVRAEIMWYLTMPVSEFILTIGNFFVLYFGGKMILNEAMSLGQLIQFTTYVAMLYEPIRWLIQIPRNLADVSVSAGKVFEILEEASDVRDAEDPVELDIKGDIEFDDVYFGYKVYNPVLKGISCKINKGEMIGIVGHSGVGKSTMINLILRLYDCTQGEIRIDGVNIKDIAQKSLRSQVGVVLQETFLFDGNVLENISYAKPDASFEEVIKAAKTANAHDFIVKLPDGYNTRVGNKGYQLSGGERQRIAIARAILHDPKIIILDEATASLDTQTEKQIQEALGKLTKGRTTIAIAHRLSTLSSADRLIVLDKGRLAEFGTHTELMRAKGVYYKLVMAQRQTTKMKKAALPQTAAEA
ncbi:ABC transporter ATP-binding protein [Ruminococcus sp. Marseille-P6503]|uniref:ABC transporter ATP-binding protein n=1 Tax=Ruminococcus sp. Marseille-P6503 TaxID=2364796 RepID=UPI000F5444F2|nr:ABC transporter ATP-binding protein [Ruminococcus sp. Marseille-P6503]